MPSNEVTVLNADSWLAQPQQLAQILAHASAGQVIPDPRGDRPAGDRVGYERSQGRCCRSAQIV